MKCPTCATELRPYQLGQNRPVETMRCHYCGGFWLTREAWRTLFVVMAQSQAPSDRKVELGWLGVSVGLIMLLVILALLVG